MYNYEIDNYDPCHIPSAGEILEIIGHKPSPDPVRMWEIVLTLNGKVVGRGLRKMTRAEVIKKCDDWYYKHFCEDIGYSFKPYEEKEVKK